MALYACKLTSTLPFLPSSSSSSSLRFRLFSSSSSSSSTPRTPWLHPTNKKPPLKGQTSREQQTATVSTSVERIVHRLRNLSEDNKEDEEEGNNESVLCENELDGNEKLGELLERSWSRPDQSTSITNQTTHVLPWERDQYTFSSSKNFGGSSVILKQQKRALAAPTMAELTLEDSELRRLRTQGMHLRERISVAKAGVTKDIVDKILESWRKNELVRLRFHESLAHDMKTAHELVERRTGGLVIWKSGSVMVVYRGLNFSLSSPLSPPSLLSPQNPSKTLIPDLSPPQIQPQLNPNFTPNPNPQSSSYLETLTEEEIEFNSMMDELGPRFEDWWGTGILPVDADKLNEVIEGYKTPFRLLPTGMRSRLTNSEMTELRHVARKLPCHFALGRNRKHQGLAQAILKLWEKSLLVKIAIKRGIQNTNNKLMAEELKRLTGGTLLQRNKFYIVIYRGKDFLPPGVASVLAERQELADDVQTSEETIKSLLHIQENQEHQEEKEEKEKREDEEEIEEAEVGTLEEFREAMRRWGREIGDEEREEMRERAVRGEKDRLVKKIDHKIYIAQMKKERAEKLLAKVEAGMVPVGPSDDREMITSEEKSVFRRIGLRMKSYLPMGIRGVFDGVIENMHLHWKHREIVKLISKQKKLPYVEDTARLLEYESGGILVSIERVPKGFALIYYRGKNYKRPISIRPRNLLSKNKALKRAVAMQRHEALSQHILDLESTITRMKIELGIDEDDEEDSSYENMSNTSKIYDDSEDDEDFSESEEDDFMESDEDENEDNDISEYESN